MTKQLYMSCIRILGIDEEAPVFGYKYEQINYKATNSDITQAVELGLNNFDLIIFLNASSETPEIGEPVDAEPITGRFYIDATVEPPFSPTRDELGLQIQKLTEDLGVVRTALFNSGQRIPLTRDDVIIRSSDGAIIWKYEQPTVAPDSEKVESYGPS
jgi:hypothetical protein